MLAIKEIKMHRLQILQGMTFDKIVIALKKVSCTEFNATTTK